MLSEDGNREIFYEKGEYFVSDKNFEKQEIYSNMKRNLAKALKLGFYYEAIFIEYAIIEDRCTSLLKHAGVKYVENNGYDIKLSKKLSKLRGNPQFVIPYVRKRMPLDFIDSIETWKQQRDSLIHALARTPYNNEHIKTCADEGAELVRLLDNKAKSINNYFNKLQNNI